MTNKLTVKRPRRKSSTHSLGAIGSPKKGGAGGKGTWGVFGDELRAVTGTTDPKDPNYDDEGEKQKRCNRNPVMNICIDGLRSGFH